MTTVDGTKTEIPNGTHRPSTIGDVVVVKTLSGREYIFPTRNVLAIVSEDE